MKRQMARAKSFGIEFEFVSPAEAGPASADPAHRRLRRRGVDSRRRQRQIRPISRSRWPRARACTARRSWKASRSKASTRPRGALPESAGGPRRTKGSIACETLVNCGGQWARAFGRLAGVNVPLYAAEHFYLVTKAIAGVSPDMPRHSRPRRLSLLQGRSRRARHGRLRAEGQAVDVDPIPDGFEFQLLPEDWDHFEILMQNAIHRTPCLETAEVKLLAERAGELHAATATSFSAKRRSSPDISSVPDSIPRASRTPEARASSSPNGSSTAMLRSILGRRHAPLRPFHANRRHLGRPHGRVARPALRDALAARGDGDGAPAASLAALRPPRGESARCSAAKMNWERAN